MTQALATAPEKPTSQVSAAAIADIAISKASQSPTIELHPDRYEHFQPITTDRHAEKQKPYMDAMHLNFPTSVLFSSYYPWLRAGGYMGELVTKQASGYLEEKFDTIKSQDGFKLAEWKTQGAREWYMKKCATQADSKGETKINFMKPMVQAESVVFTGLAAAFATKEYGQLRDNCALAVAAEMGKDAKDIDFMDMCQSSNPIISTAVDRFMWQTGSRLGQGVSFLGGLFTGVAASTALITLERTVFYRPIAYDILSKVVNDVQLNRLGDEAKPNLVDGMIRTMQAARIDQRRELLSKEQVDGMRPVLEKVAGDVINRSFGIRGVVYILGGGVIVPDNPDLSMANYEHVFKAGVEGVIEEGKWIREQTGAPTNKTWQTAVRIKRDKDYVAESAREEALVENHHEIQARGALHSGFYRDGMRGGDRSGVGMGYTL